MLSISGATRTQDMTLDHRTLSYSRDNEIEKLLICGYVIGNPEDILQGIHNGKIL